MIAYAPIRLRFIFATIASADAVAQMRFAVTPCLRHIRFAATILLPSRIVTPCARKIATPFRYVVDGHDAVDTRLLMVDAMATPLPLRHMRVFDAARRDMLMAPLLMLMPC